MSFAKYWFLILILLPLELRADFCENLSKFACSPGIHNDGTGVARSGVERLKATTAFDEFRPNVDEKFKRILENARFANFRKLAVSTAGLSNEPVCLSDKKEDIEKCNMQLAPKLSDFAKRRLTFSNRIDNGAERDDLESKSRLLKSEIFESLMREVDSEIGEKYARPRIADRIGNKMFPEIIKLLIKKLDSLPIEPKTKKLMQAKIGRIRFAGTDCSDREGGGLSKHFHPNASYSPYDESFKVCQGLFVENSSDFHLATVIAHELGHALDPCEISKGDKPAYQYKNTDSANNLDDDYPIPGLLGCLRSPKSIHAIRTNDGIYNNPNNPKKAGEKDFYSHCNSDQITESTCDWLAMEVVPDFIQNNHPNLSQEQWQVGLSNAFRPGCSTKNQIVMGPEGAESNHPLIPDRIDRIFLQNPKAREKMGCSEPHSEYLYCDANNPALLRQIAKEARLGPKPTGKQDDSKKVVR